NPEEGYYLPRLCIEMERLEGRQNYRDIDFSAYTPDELLGEIFQRLADGVGLAVKDNAYDGMKEFFMKCFARRQQNNAFDIAYMNGCYLLELRKMFAKSDKILSIPADTRFSMCYLFFSKLPGNVPKDVVNLLAKYSAISGQNALSLHKATAVAYNERSK